MGNTESSSAQQPAPQWAVNVLWVSIVVFVIVISIIIVEAGKYNSPRQSGLCNIAVRKATHVPHYRIVSVDDVSHGFPGDSAIDVKNVYRIVVPASTSPQSVEAVIRDVQQTAAQENADIDEMAIFVFDREADVQGTYTRGRGFWGVDGDIGNVTADVASSNDRSNHSLSVDLKQPIKRATTNKTHKKYDLNSNELTAFEEEVSAAVFAEMNNMPEDWDGDDAVILARIGKRFNLSPSTVRQIDAKATGIKAGMRWK